MTEYQKYLRELKEKAIEAKKKLPSERTYTDRYYFWEDVQQNMLDNTSSWDEGEEVTITDGEALYNGTIKHQMEGADFPSWFREAGKNFGKRVTTDFDKEVGILVGMTYTYLDYYYLIEYPNGKRVLHSCVGKLNIIED